MAKLSPIALKSLAASCLGLALVACQKTYPEWDTYRLDDHLDQAVVSGPATASIVREAEPVRWDFADKVVSWQPVRGRMGFKDSGELIVQGEGAAPIITSPTAPEIDWARYESILIRMLVTGGRRITLRFRDQEYTQDLGAPMQFQVYRFDLNFNAPSYKGPLEIIPTDSPAQPAAIASIELVPRKTTFPDAAGKRFLGKNSDFRSVIYSQSPGTIVWNFAVPQRAVLRFAAGVVKESAPVRFLVRNGVAGNILHETEVRDVSEWKDVEVDLAEHEGRTLDLVFETQTGTEGAVGLWANPLVTTREPKERLNLVVYMIDTLRADHTSLYGYDRETTPFLKQFGAEGVVFENCHAQATWTKPSVVSLLTSLYSVTHRVQDFADTIPPGATTLAQILRAQGYVTASIVGNPFSGRNSGLERGVDHLMEYPVLHRQLKPSQGATDSTALNAVAFPWLDRHADEPFFLYLHSTDPHAPYRPPAEYDARFADPAETKSFERDNEKLKQIGRRYGGDVVFTPAEARARGVDPDLWARRASQRYDAEIAHNDHNISELIGKLKELSVLDNTLVVIVSDHGEEFLDHGWTSHGHSLYQELTHTVLLFRNPKLFPEARRVAELVQVIDVAPTILDLLGIQHEGVMQGRSLVLAARGQQQKERGAIMSSRLPESRSAGSRETIPESRTLGYMWLDEKWKLLYRERARQSGLPEVELFDRTRDQVDATNVAPANSAEVDRILGEVRQWIDAQQQVNALLGTPGRSVMDEATLERLRSLGYVGDRAK